VNKFSQDQVDAVLLPDGWHLIKVGSFADSDETFSFISVPVPGSNMPAGSKVIGKQSSLSAVRLVPGS
jgi:hypothetical protein